MTRGEVEAAVAAHPGQRLRVTFADGVTQSTDIGSIDDEGILHGGPDGIDPNFFWTRFDSVVQIQPNDETAM